MKVVDWEVHPSGKGEKILRYTLTFSCGHRELRALDVSDPPVCLIADIGNDICAVCEGAK